MGSDEIKVKTSFFEKSVFSLERKHSEFFSLLESNCRTINDYTLKQFLNQLRLITDSLIDINQLSTIENISSVYVLVDQIDLVEKLLLNDPLGPSSLMIHLQKINDWYQSELPQFSNQIKSIRSEHNKSIRRAITKQLIQEKSDVLFHGVKHQYAKEILTRQSILGYTHQRYWENGKKHNEDDPEFDNSFRMKGISMSRDLEYALNWADVLLVFDRTKIKHRHKIEPYAWSHHFSKSYASNNPNSPSSKKEREDYVVLSKNKRTYKNQDNKEWMKEYEEIMNHSFDNMTDGEIEEFKKFQEKMTKEKDNMNLQDLTTPEGEFDFSKNDALVGVALKQTFVDVYGPDHDLVLFLRKHPLFLGIIE